MHVRRQRLLVGWHHGQRSRRLLLLLLCSAFPQNQTIERDVDIVGGHRRRCEGRRSRCHGRGSHGDGRRRRLILFVASVHGTSFTEGLEGRRGRRLLGGRRRWWCHRGGGSLGSRYRRRSCSGGPHSWHFFPWELPRLHVEVPLRAGNEWVVEEDVRRAATGRRGNVGKVATDGSLLLLLFLRGRVSGMDVLDIGLLLLLLKVLLFLRIDIRLLKVLSRGLLVLFFCRRLELVSSMRRKNRWSLCGCRRNISCDRLGSFISSFQFF